MQGMIIKAVETPNSLKQQYNKFEDEIDELYTEIYNCNENNFNEELCDNIQSLVTMWKIKHGDVESLIEYWNTVHNAKMDSRNWKERT